MNIKIGENVRSMLKLSSLVLMDKTNRKRHKCTDLEKQDH